MRIAVMQPYFFPYAGYFRLMAASDLFVIYDCVQFPRRGWVHRNMLKNRGGNPEWVTLPLAKAPQATAIRDLSFAADAPERWIQIAERFPALSAQHHLAGRARLLSGTPLSYIVGLMRETCQALGIPWNVVHSSELGLSESLRAQDRILAICEKFSATHYTNASGGRGLYQEDVFAKRGVSLYFLPDYVGSKACILSRITQEDPAAIRQEIYQNL